MDSAPFVGKAIAVMEIGEYMKTGGGMKKSVLSE